MKAPVLFACACTIHCAHTALGIPVEGLEMAFLEWARHG